MAIGLFSGVRKFIFEWVEFPFYNSHPARNLPILLSTGCPTFALSSCSPLESTWSDICLSSFSPDALHLPSLPVFVPNQLGPKFAYRPVRLMAELARRKNILGRWIRVSIRNGEPFLNSAGGRGDRRKGSDRVLRHIWYNRTHCLSWVCKKMDKEYLDRLR